MGSMCRPLPVALGAGAASGQDPGLPQAPRTVSSAAGSEGRVRNTHSSGQPVRLADMLTPFAPGPLLRLSPGGEPRQSLWPLGAAGSHPASEAWLADGELCTGKAHVDLC